jgi:iron-only hydrogenase group A
MEEGSELIKRLETGKNLPLITSCSPGWINYAELREQDLLKNISTCKSPQQMFGALSKTYYADQEKLKRENIVSVSIMPCTAKKFESKRSEMKDDVDIVLTTRELAKLIKSYSIDFLNLEITPFDAPFGISTGAAAIFGTSGGVMEAALRTAYEILTDETLDTIDFNMVRGLTGTKEATIKILDQEINVAIVSGLENAKQLLKNKEKYHFIEIMACPGGCLNGGGQPLYTDQEVLKKRMEGLYSIDRKRSIRRSHKNPAIQKIYEVFLINPLSEKSHELLHTSYKQR